MKLTCDLQAWDIVEDKDLWIFDKLILSRRLGYSCGPKGTHVPTPGYYIVRPCVNLLGMGRGAEIVHLQNDTENDMADGTFWCELFTGDHLSVDYVDGHQRLCVQGIRGKYKDLQMWEKWKKVSRKPKLPKIIENLKNRYKYLNVEMIGGKVIEVHLRLNPDFEDHNSSFVIPVYNDEQVAPNKFQDFVISPDHNRLGFYIRKQKDD